MPCQKKCHVSVNHNALYKGITFSIILGDYGYEKMKILHFKLFIGNYWFLKQEGNTTTQAR